jgi:large subunit ribosomal protein L35
MAKGNKMKTNRAAAKRFKLTASGRVKRNKAYHGHLFTAKSPKRLRNLRKGGLLASCDESRAKKMLAGGK